jgi:hypothetical protein
MSDAILALDIATRMGVAEGVLGAAVPSLYSIDFSRPKGEVEEIFGAATRWARKTFETLSPKLVAIEGLVPKYDKTIQCGLWAIVRGVAAVNGIPVTVAPIQTWRAFVLGNGKLPKREAKTRAIAVCTQLGWRVRNDDEAEAACIWIWACYQVEPRRAPKIPLFMRGAA